MSSALEFGGGKSEMKAVRIQHFGKSDVVRIEEMPIPRPKRGQALIRVHAAGVNPADWMVREKIYIRRERTECPLHWDRTFPE
jgi:NADPH:quinone reductase-like Zn-dependent oxidoreductase